MVDCCFILNPHSSDSFLVCVCVLHDLPIKNDLLVHWNWCKGDDFGVLPAPKGHHHQGLPQQQ